MAKEQRKNIADAAAAERQRLAAAVETLQSDMGEMKQTILGELQRLTRAAVSAATHRRLSFMIDEVLLKRLLPLSKQGLQLI